MNSTADWGRLRLSKLGSKPRDSFHMFPLIQELDANRAATELWRKSSHDSCKGIYQQRERTRECRCRARRLLPIRLPQDASMCS